jgi:tellurite resistance protein TehA-like permease
MRRNTTFAELNSIDMPPSVWVAAPCSPWAICGIDASSSMNSFDKLMTFASCCWLFGMLVTWNGFSGAVVSPRPKSAAKSYRGAGPNRRPAARRDPC